MDVNSVVDLHKIHIWALITNENAITAPVQIENFDDLSKIKNILRNELKEHNIVHTALGFELNSGQCTDI